MAKSKNGNSIEQGEDAARVLTDKELTFCIEFSVCENATRSYQRAYRVGYNTANAQGYKLLSDIVIRKTIDEMKIDRNERLKIDADDVIRKIKIMTEYDASDFYDDDGRLKPLSELHPDLRFVIEGMDVSERIVGEEGDGISRLMKIKLPKKLDALELLAKHLQLLGDKQKGKDLPVRKAIRVIKAEEMPIG